MHPAGMQDGKVIQLFLFPAENGVLLYKKPQVAKFESVVTSVFSAFLGIPSGMPRLVETPVNLTAMGLNYYVVVQPTH